MTDDVPRLAAFYRALMDIPEVCSDPVHQFIIAGEPSFAVYNDGRPHSAEHSPVALAFTVQDIQSAHQKLTALQARIIQPPTRQPWGTISLVFLDPDGNRIHLRQFA